MSDPERGPVKISQQRKCLSNNTMKNEDGDDWGHHTPVSENDDNGGYSSHELRQMANSYFAQKDYDSALPLYSMALDTLYVETEGEISGQGYQAVDTMVTFLCNRSACLFRMEAYEDAKADALQAVQISKGKD